MHDDQHGTAIVVLAGLMNAAKVVGKRFKDLKISISGAGAAGTAIARLLAAAGNHHVVVFDRQGAIYAGREGLSPRKAELAAFTNPSDYRGALADLVGLDALVGVSGPGSFTPELIRAMRPGAIVFALANPIPEIMPEEAKNAGARVVGTGRSDYANQLNNALVYPGLFRGALDKGVTRITLETKLRAAKALAALVPKPTAEKIIPGLLDKRVMRAIAKSVR
jgi:malate dehydrogenase (oxaloacetate-decarboxylating)